MSSCEIDLDKIMMECCDTCSYIKTVRGATGSFGEPLEPDEYVCPAGCPGEGDLKYDGEYYFYCVEASAYESSLEP